MDEERKMIAEACDELGIVPTQDEWGKDESGKTVAKLGNWYAIRDNPGGMFEEGDDGTLIAEVVGAVEYNNQRVIFSFTPEGSDSGEEVRPFRDVDFAA